MAVSAIRPDWAFPSTRHLYNVHKY
jgi:hypothetical protein